MRHTSVMGKRRRERCTGRGLARVGAAALAAVAAIGMLASGSAGQELRLIETPPPAAVMVCAPPEVGGPLGIVVDTAVAEPGDSLLGEAADSVVGEPVDTVVEDPEPAGPSPEAERLTNAATQAMLLGDLDGALEFLNRALREDSTAAEAIYLRSRVQQERGEFESAAAGLCRYLALDPDGATAPEARSRLEQVADSGVARELYETFAEGVARYDAGSLEEAEAAFERVVQARPRAAAAVYNRGLIRALLERPGPARADLERYLELAPGAPNRDLVRRYLVVLAADPGPGPGRAFLLGAVVPGAGQFYTGRPVLGTLVLGAAGGALAAGFLYERTTIRCRVANPGDSCPPDQIASTTTDQPYLAVGIGVAAGLAVVAAFEAAGRARRIQRERYDPDFYSVVRSGLERLSLAPDGVRLRLVEKRF